MYVITRKDFFQICICAFCYNAPPWRACCLRFRSSVLALDYTTYERVVELVICFAELSPNATEGYVVVGFEDCSLVLYTLDQVFILLNSVQSSKIVFE